MLTAQTYLNNLNTSYGINAFRNVSFTWPFFSWVIALPKSYNLLFLYRMSIFLLSEKDMEKNWQLNGIFSFLLRNPS